ncbi:methyl-accepting chemotaxis protein [Vibrio penaeicida]|uniref:methyl-accepting chemotaxis protein n=1 Tax=Vibrio penaeicida TaxID=104609 RepID=UPI002734BA0E|nr:methyl-accepting chemotaxis protein [Vibrio penaeicida]MDP2575690.1 methyl-accepting chemotaxis protein [Vibrio penaeicida]
MNVYQNKLIEDLRITMMSEKQEKLTAVIDTAYSTLKPALSNMKGEELKQELASRVQELRFVDGDPNSYFYIHDMQGVVIAHGSNPKNVGKSQWDLKNAKDQYIVRQIVQSAKSGDGFTIFDGYKPTEDKYYPKMTFSRYIPEQGYALTTGFYIDDIDGVIQKKKAILDDKYFSLIFTTAMVTAIAALITSSIVYVVISRTMKPLEEIGVQLEGLSKGNGDLTARLDISSNDEIGKVASSFNNFVNKLQDMLNNLSEVSHHLSLSTSKAESSNHETQSQIDKQLDQVNMVATAIEEMSSASVEIARDSEASACEVESCFTNTRQGQELTNKTKEAVEQLNHEIRSTAKYIENLNANTSDISQIIETIQGIAEQTNLLALNAAIEAARAGEFGRGFAVVADEVRSLSQKTTESASEIRDMILELQSITESTTKSIKTTGATAITSVEYINEVELQFDSITDSMKRVQQMSAQIATASEEQSTVSKEIAQNTTEVKDIAQTLSRQSQESVEEASIVNEKVGLMNSQLDQFKI